MPGDVIFSIYAIQVYPEKEAYRVGMEYPEVEDSRGQLENLVLEALWVNQDYEV